MLVLVELFCSGVTKIRDFITFYYPYDQNWQNFINKQILSIYV